MPTLTESALEVCPGPSPAQTLALVWPDVSGLRRLSATWFRLADRCSTNGDWRGRRAGVTTAPTR